MRIIFFYLKLIIQIPFNIKRVCLAYHNQRANSIFIFIIACLFTLFGCEDSLELKVPPVKKQICVDGWIEQGKYSKVLLTWNASFFTHVDSQAIKALVIRDAIVSVSDGKRTEVLTLQLNDDYFPPFIFSGTDIKGEVGKTYYLKVIAQKDTITAQTTIIKPVTLDSLWFSLKKGSDSIGVIKLLYTDNPLENNYYRTFTQVVHKEKKFIPTLVSTYNDEFFNGQTFEFVLNRGFETYLSQDFDVYFHLGDTVDVKVCTIDEPSFQFWESYQREVVNSGNPFASTFQTVDSNIKNGLGIWCGYGYTQYRIINK